MALTKDQRDSLPDSDFAVPGKRALPIVDERHVRMAWSMLPKTEGLSESERKTARSRILHKAKELGIDTSGWELHAVNFQLQAMALGMPDIAGHPNRMPFSGVLTRLDEPSDAPPGGSGGHRTLLPKDVAEQALPSLLGMAIDYTPDFDGHDKKAKIGVITEATIQGNAVNIAGFLYAADFPEECARIQAEKNQLGLSYECRAAISDPAADPWEITACVFTGAAVLYKDLAAYTTTSLAAKAETGIDMTKEELEAILNAGLKPLNEKLDAQGVKLDEQGKKISELEAKGASLGGPVVDQVKPHVEALNAAADALENAGIGTDRQAGHAGVIRRVAAHLAAAAVSGKVPTVFTDHDYLPSARIEASKQESDKLVKELKDQLASMGTQIADLKAAAVKGSPEPQRRTLSADVQTLLSKAGLKLEAGADGKDGKLTVEQVDKALEATGVKGVKAIEAKLKLRQAGVMQVAAA